MQGPTLQGVVDTVPFQQRVLLLLPACAVCALWIISCRRLAPGARRLAAALPVVAFNCAAPLLYRQISPLAVADGSGDPQAEIVTIVLVEFALTWLCSFKLICWAANRGPLANNSWNSVQFAAIMLAPITPVEDADSAARPAERRSGRQGEHAGGAGGMALAFLGKVAIIVGVLAALQLDTPPLAHEFLYSLGLYAVLGFVMDGPAAVASSLIGVRVSPHFDSPWRSISFSDFWSARWDLAAGNTLRQLVYEPLLEGRLVHQDGVQQQQQQRRRPSTRASSAADGAKRAQRRLLGTAACFLMSGVMHEMQFAYMTGHTSHGLMMIFFLTQVPLLVAERWLTVTFRQRGWRAAPALLRVLGTLATLLLLSHWTFWHAANKHGVTQTSIVSLTGSLEAALQLVAGGRG